MNEPDKDRTEAEIPICITEQKVRIHQRYQGDNYFAWEKGLAMPGDYDALSEEEWRAIDELLQRLYFAKAGLAAECFNAQTERLLRQRTATPEVALLLRELAV